MPPVMNSRPPAQQGSGLPAAERRRRRREWRIAGAVAAGLALLVAFEQNVLSLSRSLPIGSGAVFLVLMHVNVLGIGLLVFLCARNVTKLVVERRRGLIGARLGTRFVVSFLLTAVVSTTALFLLSGFLVNHAVDTWFRAQISNGLVDSVGIANAYYREAEETTLAAGRGLADQIQESRLLRGPDRARLRALLERKREEYGVGVLEVVSGQREILARAVDPEGAVVAFEGPDSELVAAGFSGEERTVIVPAGQGELVRGVVPVRSTRRPAEVVAAIVVNRFLPHAMETRVAAVHGALDVYRGLQSSDGPFQVSMWWLLAMITLVSVLFSSWMGFRLAKQVLDPIQRLASATAELGAGKLDVHVEQRGDDEIGLLVAAFNRMADDVRASRDDLEERRRLMETILRGVAAGVLALDRERAITSINPSAMRLLGVPLGQWTGHKADEVLGQAALDTLAPMLARLAESPQRTLRRQVPIAVGDEQRTLNWTVSGLVDAEGERDGWVLVLDDVTQLLHAQRVAAWRDVARRIAHEIKNPLTPIQLSSQRLRRKLEEHLDPAGRQVLRETTDAISGQIEAMKSLLGEFSNFARLPATEATPTDLNQLVTDTLALYKGRSSIRFATELAQDLPRLDLDREQIKRVILNLVENAIASIESAGPGPREIRVATRFEEAVDVAQLEVSDTGHGIRSEDRARLFQPGFSTKQDGTGIGLAIVSRIVSDHSGYIRVRGNEPRGARFIIELPVRAA
jgi:two-component system nitrogen regulation sensor histidine kinase NtrY